MASRQPSLAVTDAKSVFDTLMMQTAGSKLDRRSAIDSALLRQRFEWTRTKVRWVPHVRMPADMTKSDVSRGNAALSTGRWKLLDEHRAVGERCTGKSKPGRSKTVSQKELKRTWTETFRESTWNCQELSHLRAHEPLLTRVKGRCALPFFSMVVHLICFLLFVRAVAARSLVFPCLFVSDVLSDHCLTSQEAALQQFRDSLTRERAAQDSRVRQERESPMLQS